MLFVHDVSWGQGCKMFPNVDPAKGGLKEKYTHTHTDPFHALKSTGKAIFPVVMDGKQVT